MSVIFTETLTHPEKLDTTVEAMQGSPLQRTNFMSYLHV
jgi:hypothetical protein